MLVDALSDRMQVWEIAVERTLDSWASLRPPAPGSGQAPDQDVLAWTDGRRVAEVRKFATDAKPPVSANDVASFKLRNSQELWIGPTR